MKQPKILNSTRMQITILSFIIILILSLADSNSAGVAIPTIGSITIAIISGKTVTDHKILSTQSDTSPIGNE